MELLGQFGERSGLYFGCGRNAGYLGRDRLPPKPHSLLYLSGKALVQFPEDLQEFIEQLDNVSVVTRYPEDLKKLSKEFNKNKTEKVLLLTRRTLRWLRRDKRLKI